MYGYPGPFGARLTDTALTLPVLAAAEPLNACGGAVAPPPVPGAGGLVARGNCSFAVKAQALQQAGFGAMLLFNNEEGEWAVWGMGRGGSRWLRRSALLLHSSAAAGQLQVHTPLARRMALPPPPSLALQSAC